jgi:hypothetical protein
MHCWYLKIEKKLWAIFSKVEKRDRNNEGAEGAIQTIKDVRKQKYELSVLKLLTPCIFNQIIFSYQTQKLHIQHRE